MLDGRYPDYSRMRKKTEKNIPKFIYEYLEGGCFDDIGLETNRLALQSSKLAPRYLAPYSKCDLKTTILGKEYSAPFGIAPIGLQGLIWPNSPVILAKAAKKYNIPYILSTVSSESIEVIAELAEDNAWFQLYNPVDETIQDSILGRLKSCGYKNLVVTVDIPTFGFRPNDIVNGLTMPPKYSVKNFIDVCKTPHWATQTLKYGIPKFKNLEPYMREHRLDLPEMMRSMAMGKVDTEGLKRIRDKWEGNLIVKGVCSSSDLKLLEEVSADGVILSNHGARQLDACESPIDLLRKIDRDSVPSGTTMMMDSGIRSGVDIATSLASGAQFTFLGRFFMYAVSSLGKEGGEHAIEVLMHQLTQVMEQIRCEKPSDLSGFLAN
ncbi:alpha-hydroxy-acid oxidizing protein [Vibrio sp. D404a]|uniref:alpha-hydroxy acid oxidase n=1 Tax=unclassified Vibrio TaxID=2614977 RepID=UPI002556594C|nr:MULTISPECIES: alpha-hydroxy acid oxidase [unclassified Vibrio]MDK9738898.1 alpha-hydroxy-acid oxidizing protein [Vibrio sp. D404a]MDK9798327.1 alpha-hydroxy-acid oxidizing protein [Vibrio sp. D449a]